MWQQNVSKVMSHLGWGSGFRLPIANEENLALERRLETLHRLLQDRHAELQDVVRHKESLEKAVKNTADHISHDTKLISAKHTAISSENELLKLSRRDGQRIARECKNVQATYKTALSKNNQLILEINSRRKELNELAELIEYDRKELAVIEVKSANHSEFLKMIEDLCEEDEELVKKYEVRYQKATSESTRLKHELEEKVAFTRVLQADFDGLSDKFRKLHGERGEIVDLWKKTLGTLSSKDEKMKSLAEEYRVVEKRLKSQLAKVEEERAKLDNQKKFGEISLMQLNKWDRKVMDLREEIKRVGELGQSFKDSVISYETGITLASNQIQELNKKCSQIEKEIEERNAKVGESIEKIEELKEKAETSVGHMLSASERMKEINNLIDEEERKLDWLGKNLEKEMIRKSHWSEKMEKLSKKKKDMDHEIRGAGSNLQFLANTYKNEQAKLEKRKSMIYQVELQLVSANLKFKSYVNPRAHDPQKYSEYQQRVMELKYNLDELVRLNSSMNNQILQITNINRKMYREKVSTEKEIEVNQRKCSEYRVCVKFGTKKSEQMDEEWRNAIVHHSLVKLKLSQMLKAVSEQKSMLYDSEHHRTLLTSAAKEKRSEIELHSRLLETRKRGIKEELTNLKIQFSEVTDNLSKKRKRYEIIMKLMSKPLDDSSPSDSEEIKSEAYYVLRAAQEREFLRIEGDKWDAKVKEAEVETEALQNSLKVIQCSNDLFKESLRPIEDEAYNEEMKKHKEQERKSLVRKSKTLSLLRSLRDEIHSKKDAGDILQRQIAHFANKLIDKQYELRVIHGELNNQALSGKRAKIFTNKLLRDIAFAGPQEKAVVSLDIKLRATRRKFEFGVQALAKLLNLQPALYEIIGKLLAQRFGEDIAVKFLKRVSPMIGDFHSPSVSVAGTARRTPTTKVLFRDVKSGLAFTKDVPKLSHVPQDERPSIDISSFVNPTPSSLLAEEKLPERTQSEKELLKNLAAAIEEDRKHILEEREHRQNVFEDMGPFSASKMTKSQATDLLPELRISPPDNIVSSSSISSTTTKTVSVTSNVKGLTSEDEGSVTIIHTRSSQGGSTRKVDDSEASNT